MPWGIAANPNLPGDVYVADEVNERVDQFTAWGEFVRAWGWGVKDGSNEFQVCTPATGCQQGKSGGGAGQFTGPEAITVDALGTVYVLEGGNHRVQKFDSEGNFILTFGLDVNKTKEEGGGTQAERNVCTAASGDVCQAGKVGTGPGELQFSFPAYTNRLTVSQVTGTVFVAERDKRIQAFNPSGSFKEEIKGDCLTGKVIRALTSDVAGNLYVAFAGGTEVRKLKPTGPTAECLEPKVVAASVFALAVGPEGHLFADVEAAGEEPPRILEFDANGVCLNCGDKGEEGKEGFDRSPEFELKSVAVGAACGPVNVYVTHFKASASQAFFRIFGEPPNVDDCPPPPRAPVIGTQYALSAEISQATVQAQINPNFFPTTRYYVEYGTSSCAVGGCPNQAPVAAPGSILTTKTTKSQVKTAAVVLEGLAPGTTYHYRFVAESSGGGPVFGTGPEPTPIAGGEATFRTYAEPEVEPCPINAAFRTRASALLPDCRAYELVSPLDKASGDILALREGTTELPSTLDQSSVNGNRMAYGSYRSFGDAVSAPFTTQYIAARGTDGWASHAISPPRERLTIIVTQHADTELKALSPDLCESWWRTLAEPEPPLDPAAVPHYPNLMKRQDNECGGTAWEAITTVKPPNLPSGKYFDLELQGRSADGDAVIYATSDSLDDSGAPPQPPTCNAVDLVPVCALKLYYRATGESVPTYVCVLPNGTPLAGGCSAGTYGGDAGKMRMTNLQGAFSEDGSRVFWGGGSGPSPAGPNPIYMRENPGTEETTEDDGGGNCVPDPVLACTIAVSKVGEELSATTSSRFWAAAGDGGRAIFAAGGESETSVGGDLYSFEVETRTTTLIAEKVLGVVGTSADAKRIYFVSEEACGGAGQVGDRNLYLYEEGDECAAGEMAFIAELAAPDVDPEPLKATSTLALEPSLRSTRVSADGLTAAFMSSAAPTGYDNTDRLSGKADAEVYRYDASANGGAGELLCVSCNPSGARPLGRDVMPAVSFEYWVSGQLRGWQNNLYASRALSEDGTRLYFESFDALTPRDTNGITDVYQWEAPGSGGCTEVTPSFSPQNGGCVDLISSGQGAQAARFHDASPDGSNVFFSTLESLLGQDYGLIDIYVARIDGGFPEPPPPALECEGENCQKPNPPPLYITPSSALYDGPGNLEEKPPKKACPKGKVKKGGKCVKKGKKGKKRQGR